MILAAVVGIFLVSLLLKVPVAFSLILASSIPVFLDPGVRIAMMTSRFFAQMRSFPLLAIPLFILCGKLLGAGGATDDLVYISKVLVWRLRGAMAHVNVVASIFFAGISGSSVADVCSIGTVLIPGMKKEGYSAEFSASITAASAAIGNIIPPSILMIVYGAIAQTSIAALFLGGIIPGILIGLMQMIYCYYYARTRNVGGGEYNKKPTFEMKKKALIKGIFPASIFLIIIVGITSGVFTPSEAGAFAVIYSFIIIFFVYKKQNIKTYINVARQSAIDTATIYILICGASFFAWVLTYYRAMLPIVNLVQGAGVGQIPFLITIAILYVILGTFMEPASAMLIFVPLLRPIVTYLAINPVVLGIITVMSIRVGTITPPYGLSTLMAAKIAEVSVAKMMKHILILLGFYMFVVFVLIFFQDIILFLPNMFL